MGRGIPIRLPGPKKHKYRAKRTEVDGISFASQKEANRWCELKVLERAGKVINLERQPRFELIVNGRKVGKYVADFRYFEKRGELWEPVVEDVKGFHTEIYKMKKELMLATRGIEVQEV